MRAHPALAAGAVLAAIAGAIVLVSLVWTPHAPARIAMGRRLQGPSELHLLGTDHFGRDLASMMMVGMRNSLAVAGLGVALGAALGIAIGLFVAAARGLAEEATMRVVDFVFAFPAVLAAVIVIAIMGPGSVPTSVAIAVTNIAVFARLTRAVALDLWSRELVRAARALGCGPVWITLRHVLPGVSGVLIVQVTVQLAVALLIEAGLSYLGLGVQPPEPSLGRMLADAQTHMGNAPTLAIFPGVGLAVLVLGINLLGDGLRDWLDPRARGQVVL